VLYDAQIDLVGSAPIGFKEVPLTKINEWREALKNGQWIVLKSEDNTLEVNPANVVAIKYRPAKFANAEDPKKFQLNG
jgi:hypothetical protein